jgi:hypothetical protein
MARPNLDGQTESGNRDLVNALIKISFNLGNLDVTFALTLSPDK